MSGRGVWGVFAVCVIAGYAIGTGSWPAALVAVWGMAVGCPLVVTRVRRAEHLERWLRPRSRV